MYKVITYESKVDSSLVTNKLRIYQTKEEKQDQSSATLDALIAQRNGNPLSQEQQELLKKAEQARVAEMSEKLATVKPSYHKGSGVSEQEEQLLRERDGKSRAKFNMSLNKRTGRRSDGFGLG